MAHALNLTLRIKQDPDTLKRLAYIGSIFTTQIQPKIDAALRKSQIVHFARVLVIDNKYLQVITEYDGPHTDYTEFFRTELPDVFAMLFSLAENAPGPEAMQDPDKFFEFSKGLQYRSLGDSVDGDKDQEGHVAGYLFSAYGNKEVREILPKLSS
ncbi:hypothetical protein [Bradyrhizobium genosp. A]|uniref:hypothetical protein n=1 Tax=Bradyrhizobium genosp. A TaxID=83626 RepID=UPI003CEE30D8